ncbi:MAG TPA: hypothetical protein PLI78_13420, partial [Dokdonella sp.]|nr:hypothetical protein [Dokdonella sp.]
CSGTTGVAIGLLSFWKFLLSKLQLALKRDAVSSSTIDDTRVATWINGKESAPRSVPRIASRTSA